MMTEFVLISIGIVMMLATILPLIPKDVWWVRIFDFPRLQITFIIAFTIGGYVFVWQPWEPVGTLFLAGLSTSFAFQLSVMIPYTLLVPKQVQMSTRPQKAASFTVLFANVLMENRKVIPLRKLVQQVNPDVMLFVETDGWWDEQLSMFSGTHPYFVRQPQDNYYGMVLYSRLELIDPKVEFLVQADVPSIHTSVRLDSGDEVRLYCLHPKPPIPPEQERSTERDVELLLVAREVKQRAVPTVVMGDLNDVAWSGTNTLFLKISGLLDPRIGRGFYNSFHAKIPFIRYPLDHFFHSDHFRLIDFKRLSPIGSDHFPMMISLSYEPDAEGHQGKWHADESEQQEVREKLEEVR